MSQSLSRWQAIILGLVVLLAGGVAVCGLATIAAKQGLWTETVEVTVAFPEVHDIAPGTPVRIRGLDAGQVVAVEYPESDGPDAAVTVRLRLNAKYGSRLFADASAQIHSTGLLGQKVIAVNPGTGSSDPLADGRLKATAAPDFSQAAAKLSVTAEEATALIREIRTSDGTVAKLLRDDELYKDLKGLAADSRAMVKRAESAVGTVESEAGNVRTLVSDGRETLRSVRQGTDALQKMPLVRNYVEDPVAVLTRPEARRETRTYNAGDLFEPGTSILTEGGKTHLGTIAVWLKDVKDREADVVVTAGHDPADTTRSAAVAEELTRKQCDAVVEFLKASGAHKMGWVTRRKITPLGLGTGPHPVASAEPIPPSFLQVVLFHPQ